MKNGLVVLALTLCASAVHAEPPSPKAEDAAVRALVQDKVLTPLKKVETKRSKFSRARPVPMERRVRVPSAQRELDTRGKEFVRFAIDERPGWDDQGAWQEGRVVGCVYLGERKVFVRQGDGYVPAAALLGDDVSARPGVCQSAVHAALP
jgi:hypothetical protein